MSGVVDRARCDIGRFLLRGVCGALPESHREWGEALLAESGAIDDSAERLRFAISGAWGMTIVVIKDGIAGRVADPHAVLVALSAGFAAAVTDLAASSRAPGAALIGLTCLTLGAFVGRAAWRWPLLVGGMLPLLITITGRAGPYEYDRADQWYAVIFAVACTALGITLRAATFAALRAMGHDVGR